MHNYHSLVPSHENLNVAGSLRNLILTLIVTYRKVIYRLYTYIETYRKVMKSVISAVLKNIISGIICVVESMKRTVRKKSVKLGLETVTSESVLERITTRPNGFYTVNIWLHQSSVKVGRLELLEKKLVTVKNVL